jgi:hypothetical protein
MAGALYVTVGLKPILAIDIFTSLFALGTMVAAHFPQPEQTGEGQEGKGSFWWAAAFGWHYLHQRPGLLHPPLVFAALNFCISNSFPLFTPMILEMDPADILGYISSRFNVGMLVGTLIMRAMGGFKRRIYAHIWVHR